MLLRLGGQGLSHKKHKPLETATAELVWGEGQTVKSCEGYGLRSVFSVDTVF